MDLSEGKCVILASRAQRISGPPSTRDGADFQLKGLGLTCLRCGGADDDRSGGYQTDRGPQAVPGPCIHHESTCLVVVSSRSQHWVT